MIKIEGIEYPFIIGTFLHEKIVEEQTGGSLIELYNSMEKKPASGTLDLIYSGLVAGARKNRKACKLSKEDLELLLDETDLSLIMDQIRPKEKKKVTTTSS